MPAACSISAPSPATPSISPPATIGSASRWRSAGGASSSRRCRTARSPTSSRRTRSSRTRTPSICSSRTARTTSPSTNDRRGGADEIEEALLDARYDYVALGHWHLHERKGRNVFYSGSTERIGLADLATTPGYARVILNGTDEPEVSHVPLPARQHLKLPFVDGTELSAEAIVGEVVRRLERESAATRAEAIVLSSVRDTALGIDREVIRQLRGLAIVRACWAFVPDVRAVRAPGVQTEESSPIGQLLDEFSDFVAGRAQTGLYEPAFAATFRETGRKLLEEEMRSDEPHPGVRPCRRARARTDGGDGMILQKLRIEHFKRLHDVEIVFPSIGIIGVVGANGAGKSTLFEAMLWALFRPNAIGIDNRDVVPRRSVGVTTKVELTIETDDTVYTISRSLRITAGGSQRVEASVFKGDDPEPLVTGANPVSDFVRGTLLRMSSQSFTTTFFTRQKELAFFGEMGDTERRREMQRLLDMDAIERAQARLREDRNRERSALTARTAQLGEENAARDLDAERAVAEQAEAEVAARVATLTEEHERLSADYDRRATRMESLRALQRQHEALQAERRAAETAQIAARATHDDAIRRIALLHDRQRRAAEIAPALACPPHRRGRPARCGRGGAARATGRGGHARCAGGGERCRATLRGDRCDDRRSRCPARSALRLGNARRRSARPRAGTRPRRETGRRRPDDGGARQGARRPPRPDPPRGRCDSAPPTRRPAGRASAPSWMPGSPSSVRATTPPRASINSNARSAPSPIAWRAWRRKSPHCASSTANTPR